MARERMITVFLRPPQVIEIRDALECWRDENGSGMTGEWLERVDGLIALFKRLAGAK